MRYLRKVRYQCSVCATGICLPLYAKSGTFISRDLAVSAYETFVCMGYDYLPTRALRNIRYQPTPCSGTRKRATSKTSRITSKMTPSSKSPRRILKSAPKSMPPPAKTILARSLSWFPWSQCCCGFYLTFSPTCFLPGSDLGAI
eukprot:901721-Rhodomonas_salina.2